MLDKRFRKIILLLRSNGGPTCAQLVCVVLVLDDEVQTYPRIHLVLAFGEVSLFAIFISILKHCCSLCRIN